jgi:hypothetical protein
MKKALEAVDQLDAALTLEKVRLQGVGGAGCVGATSSGGDRSRAV